MTNITLFPRSALKEAYEMGRQAAIADPSNWREVFEAGERKGSGWLNEASNSPGFSEYMAPRRSTSPGSFNSWIGRREKHLSIPVEKEAFEIIATEKQIEKKTGQKLITMDAIERAVRDVFSITIDELRYSEKQTIPIKTPRQYCSYLGYFHLHNALSEMGDRWGERNYSTIIHGAKCVARNAALYEKYKRYLTLLYRNLLKSGYNITHLVRDDKVHSRTGINRLKIEPIKIDL